MSIGIMSLIFRAEINDLPYTKDGENRNAKASTVKLLLLAYADHSNDEGEGAYPGYNKLEIKTALSRQGIADTLEALKQNNFMVFEGVSKLNTNSYKINKDMLESLVKPLDSDKSSHLTQPSQATRLKPSFNHPSTQKSIQRPDFQALSPEKYRTIPELKTFIDATHWIPGSFVLDVVYDFVHAGLTHEKISAAFSEWTARGYKASNVKGYLTWARDGIPPVYSRVNKQTTPTEPKAFEGIRQFMEGVSYGNTN